jgi:hypothetical protein
MAKKQGYNARLDESLEKKRYGHKYGSDAEMDYRKIPFKNKDIDYLASKRG